MVGRCEKWVELLLVLELKERWIGEWRWSRGYVVLPGGNEMGEGVERGGLVELLRK